MIHLKPKTVPRYRFTEEELVAYRPDILVAEALDAWRMPYSPYSHYRVGAAIRTAGGEIYKGCNVECADYLGTHAEEAGLAAMIMNGPRDPRLIAIVGALDPVGGHGARVDFAMPRPCGNCRQKLMEFARYTGWDIAIVAQGGIIPGEDFQYVLLSDLLPETFGPDDFGVDCGGQQ